MFMSPNKSVLQLMDQKNIQDIQVLQHSKCYRHAVATDSGPFESNQGLHQCYQNDDEVKHLP